MRVNWGLSGGLNAPLTRLRRELPQRGSLLFEPLTPGEVARRRRDGEGLSRRINTPSNPNLKPSLVAPFPSVGQRRQNRTLSARSRQQGDPFDRSTMLPPRGKARVREGRPRESKTQRSPRRQDAARPLGGGFKYTEMGLRFRAFKARKPLPLFGKIRKKPFPAGKGFLRLPLLVLFSSEDEKSTPQSQTIQPKHHFSIFQTPTHFSTVNTAKENGGISSSVTSQPLNLPLIFNP